MRCTTKELHSTNNIPLAALHSKSTPSKISYTHLRDYIHEPLELRLKRINLAKSITCTKPLNLCQTDADLLVNHDELSMSGREKTEVLRNYILVKKYEINHLTQHRISIIRTKYEQIECLNIIKRIMDNERVHASKDNIVLYHATKNYPQNYIDTRLALLYNKLIKQNDLHPDTLIFRQKSTDTVHVHKLELDKDFEDIVAHGKVRVSKKDLKKSKSEYLKYGVIRDSYHINELLSCCPALFNNLLSSGESAFGYWLNNANMSNRLINIKDIIDKYDILKEHAADEVCSLESSVKAYCDNTVSSTMLQIILPRETFNNYAYVSQAYGVKFHKLDSIHGVITDGLEMIDTVKNNPFIIKNRLVDAMQVRLYLQDHSLYKQMQVHAYNLDSELLNVFKEEVNLCIKRIHHKYAQRLK